MDLKKLLVLAEISDIHYDKPDKVKHQTIIEHGKWMEILLSVMIVFLPCTLQQALVKLPTNDR